MWACSCNQHWLTRHPPRMQKCFLYLFLNFPLLLKGLVPFRPTGLFLFLFCPQTQSSFSSFSSRDLHNCATLAMSSLLFGSLSLFIYSFYSLPTLQASVTPSLNSLSAILWAPRKCGGRNLITTGGPARANKC
ncbi:hypothetical protein, unlikely [Trypanosoma brucei gambiense DAL972]|uniref:Uncharacterized protein n=1 Tax=Trypanosoma brucei gambiense (strain MHOM/CI/86/DAL972) TaxID=679716 RepID=D0A1F4_TRYB9|nr:hypothetical protein, unlikely [Trypanosoma brucei gambiense DAL972]CBH15096.1 hypothetical protein, unlikely [Trypanosoma brucei gambiense DAL972]|eukprot:XP_011777362.1 hypothetical protein, unlikely [Trypanosoma brucei gambiense DAL972]